MVFKNLFLCALVFVLSAAHVQARVDIIPQRLLMESRDRSAEITILNLYDEPSLYRISLLNYQQNIDGTYTTLDHPLSEVFDPEEVVRVSPKQFTVAAGGGRQKVRISLRKPSDLPEGEYRFHVLATRYKSQQGKGDSDDGVQINLVMNVGVAIPVVVRHGELSVDAKISEANLNVETGAPRLFVTVDRQGAASALGKLEVFWTPQGGEPEKVGRIKNMNVFTEIDSRTIAVPLNSLSSGPGSLRVVYVDDDGNVIDEKTLQL